MPYRRKDSLIWWVSYSDPSGQRIRRSTETTNRREARALEAKWKLEAHNSKQWGQQPSRTFEELMLGYLRAKSDEKRPWGFRRDLDATRHLKAYYIGWDLADITPGSVRGYIARRRNEDVSDLTIKRELCVLSAAFNYARTEWEWDLRNPVPGRKLKEPEGRIRWITHTEAAALIQVAEIEPQAPHLADFIHLALHTGCRKGELLGLEWSRVDLQANLVYLDSNHTKTGKRRSVPLNKDARDAIIKRARFRAQHCPGSPWVFAHADGERIRDAKRAFATACRRAGIRDFRIHDLRHTCAAWLVSAEVPLTAVRDLLGHTTIKMTERYAHLAPENIRAAVLVLEGVMSRSGHAVDSKESNIA